MSLLGININIASGTNCTLYSPCTHTNNKHMGCNQSPDCRGDSGGENSHWCLHYLCVCTVQVFLAKHLNTQQSITVCTVYGHSLYIAAYPGAEVLLLIPAAYKWQEGQNTLTVDSTGGKMVQERRQS